MPIVASDPSERIPPSAGLTLLEEHASNVIQFMREKADVLGLRGTF